MTTLRRKRKNLIFRKINLTLGSSVFWLSYNRITGVVTSARVTWDRGQEARRHHVPGDRWDMGNISPRTDYKIDCSFSSNIIHHKTEPRLPRKF